MCNGMTSDGELKPSTSSGSVGPIEVSHLSEVTLFFSHPESPGRQGPGSIDRQDRFPVKGL